MSNKINSNNLNSDDQNKENGFGGTITKGIQKDERQGNVEANTKNRLTA